MIYCTPVCDVQLMVIVEPLVSIYDSSRVYTLLDDSKQCHSTWHVTISMRYDWCLPSQSAPQLQVHHTL